MKFTLISGLTNGATYALAGLAFALVFFVAGRFHYAFALWYSVSGLFTAYAVQYLHWNKWPAIVIGLTLGILGGVGTELFVYRSLDRRSGGLSLLGVFIASLGLVIAGEATLALIFKQAATFNFRILSPYTYRPGGYPLPEISILIFVTCWVILVGTWVGVNQTSLGRQIRALEHNRDLAADFGVNTGRIILIVFAIVSAIGGVLGILQAASSSASPTMGESVVIYAIVVAFFGRGRSILAIGLIGEALGVLEALVGYKFGQLLQSLVVFVILFIFITGVSYLPLVARLRSRRHRAIV